MTTSTTLIRELNQEIFDVSEEMHDENQLSLYSAEDIEKLSILRSRRELLIEKRNSIPITNENANEMLEVLKRDLAEAELANELQIHALKGRIEVAKKTTDSNRAKQQKMQASLVWVKDVEVRDPDTGKPIDVSIYKDTSTEAMVGVDSSWPDDAILSPYEDNTDLIFPE